KRYYFSRMARYGEPALQKTAPDLVKTLLDSASFRAVNLPIYRLTDNKIVGYEMLSRGPRGPLEMPETFLKVCIEREILEEVDLICLRNCIEGAKSLPSDSRFHINLFPSTILQTPIKDLLAFFPANRKNGTFCIEIVEQQKISDTEKLHEKLATCKE